MHEAFLLYTAACYISNEFADAKHDTDFDLFKVPVDKISNQT